MVKFKTYTSNEACHLFTVEKVYLRISNGKLCLWQKMNGKIVYFYTYFDQIEFVSNLIEFELKYISNVLKLDSFVRTASRP